MEKMEYLKKRVLYDNNKYRFTVPASEIKRIYAKTGDYIKISLRKNRVNTEYYASIPSIPPSRTNLQLKRNIPKWFAEKTKIKKGEKIEFSVSLVKNYNKSELIQNDKLDILSAVPQYSRYKKPIMVDRFIRDGEEFLRIWYCSGQGGKAKQVEIKRWINLDRQIGYFFGLMQAESRKGGSKFDFTNNLISEHKLFIEIAERFGIERKQWKYITYYNSKMSKSLIKERIFLFNKIVKNRKKHIMIMNNFLSKVAFCVYIDNSLLSALMYNILLKLRREISFSSQNNITNGKREFILGFISKDLIGDGTVTTNKKYGQISVIISEQDIESQKDIVRMLNIFSIKSNIIKNRIYLSSKLSSCLWFLENDIFKGHNNRKKLLIFTIDNYNIKKFYYRFKSNGKFSKIQFSIVYNLRKQTAYAFLYNNKKKGWLESDKGYYKLSIKGRKIIEIIKNAEKELSTLSQHQ